MESTGRRKRVRVSSPLAPVRLARVNVNGAAVTHQGIEILDDFDEWQCISIHSGCYNLISNAQVAEITDDILAGSQIRWTPAREIWSGKYWARIFSSDVSVDCPRVGDTLSLGLRVENSYDGSARFRMVLMGYVLSCTNGLISPKHFSSYSLKHIGDEEPSHAVVHAHLEKGIREVEALLPIVDRLSSIPFTSDLLCEVASKIGLPNSEWGHICKLIGGAETSWDLMQAITHRLSHTNRGRAGLLDEERAGDFFFTEIANRAA